MIWGLVATASGAMTFDVDVRRSTGWPLSVQWTEGDEHELQVLGVPIRRSAPSCASATACIATARRMADWPEQLRGDARGLLEPHCQDGVLDACVALEGVFGKPSAWACLDDSSACWTHFQASESKSEELLERACNAEVAEACEAGAELEEGEERMPWLERSCNLGQSCEERDALALTLRRDNLTSACEAGNALGCLGLADRVGDGSHAGRTSTDWVQEACVHGSADGCNRYELEVGRLGLGHPDVTERLEALVGQCRDQGHAGSCRVAGTLLRKSRARDLQYGEALVLLGEGCAGGDGWSCQLAGEYRREGKARQVDEGPMQHWQLGCEDGHAPSCTAMAMRLYRRRSTREEGVKSLKDACVNGGASGCAQLGDTLRKQDPDRAQALFERACEGGDGFGCRRSGEFQLDKERLLPEHDAFPSFAAGCDARDAKACLETAGAHARLKTEWDAEERYRRTKQGCEAGSIDGVEACRSQARLLKHGTGVERDRPNGKALARAYAKRRPTRYIRVMVGTGFPAPGALGLEGVLPVRLPLSVSLFGEISNFTLDDQGLIGGLLGQRVGFRYASMTGRVYLGSKGRGVYGGAGFTLSRVYGEPFEIPEGDPELWPGATVRVGLTSQSGWLVMNVEVGVMTLPVDDLPLIPTLALRLGVAPK